jgi:hypothetical protein
MTACDAAHAAAAFVAAVLHSLYSIAMQYHLMNTLYLLFHQQAEPGSCFNAAQQLRTAMAAWCLGVATHPDVAPMIIISC